jgi:uncharacterized membrane protein YjgN (DUF898 family)
MAQALRLAPSTVPVQPACLTFAFHGSGHDLLGIFVSNLFKILLTAGVYYFWAKVKTRQYLWGQSDFYGDRFRFHGTGKELLVGWVRAAILFGGLIAVNEALGFIIESPAILIVKQIAFVTLFLALIAIAQVGAMRYRLSRTSWRGIRFSFHGSYGPFVWLSFRASLLMVLTLGLYYPYYRVALRRYLTEHAAFGTAAFEFDGQAGDLFGKFVLTVLLTIPTLGLVWVWYAAQQRRYLWDHTRIAQGRFRCTATGWGIFELGVVNIVLFLLTLGLATPWITVRTMRYNLNHLLLQGPVDLEGTVQAAQQADPVGEELADLLNADMLPN